MANEINDNGLYIVKESNGKLFSGFTDFSHDTRIDRLYKDMKYFVNSKISSYPIKDNKRNTKGLRDKFCESIKDKYRDFYTKVKAIDKNHFRPRSYVTVVSSSYSRFSVITPAELDEYSFEYIYKYFASFLLELELSYKHKITRNVISSNKSIKAYSHRIPGFNRVMFKLDKNFQIYVDTNFGYGGSSYFNLVLLFDDIPIIPFTKIIYYQYANASSILHYTQDYNVTDNSWRSCFDFTVSEINDFNNRGSKVFIKEKIKESLDELMELLDMILKTDMLYFINSRQLDSYLGFKNKQIIYDYEHLLNNNNPNAINIDAINRLLSSYKSLSEIDQRFDIDEETRAIMKDILPEGIKNTNDKFLIDRYAYALAVLIDRKYKENLEFNLYNHYYHNPIGKIIKGIIPNYKALIYKYSGYNLQQYRSSRVEASLKLITTIEKLKDYLPAKKYFSSLIKFSKKVTTQNKEYLEYLNPKIIKAKKEFEEKEAEWLQEKESFETTTSFKNYNTFENYLISLKKTFEYNFFDVNENRITIDDDILKERIMSIFEVISNIDSEVTKEGLINLDEYGNSIKDSAFGVGRLRMIYEETKKQSDRDALILSMRLLQKWQELIEELLKFSYNDIENNLEDIKNSINYHYSELIEIKKNLSDLTDKANMNISTIRVYVDNYKVNNDKYVKSQKEYKSAEKKLKQLSLEKEKFNTVYKDLSVKKESIEKYNESIKELSEEINGG